MHYRYRSPWALFYIYMHYSIGAHRFYSIYTCTYPYPPQTCTPDHYMLMSWAQGGIPLTAHVLYKRKRRQEQMYTYISAHNSVHFRVW